MKERIAYMKNKLLLINLPSYLSMKSFIEDNYNYNPSLGLMAICQYIEMFGFSSYVMDYNYEDLNLYKLYRFIDENNISVIGVTVYTENLNLAKKFMHAVKSYKPEIIIFAGGPHATLRGNDLIKSRYVDYIVTKDGEGTILELLAHLEYGESNLQAKQIKGISYKKDGNIETNEEAKVVQDLNLLPIINRECVDIQKYCGMISMYTSKGCPGRCIYCSSAFISGGKYRVRSIENVFLECQLIKNQLKDKEFAVYFVDDTFTANTNRVKKFCELINKYNFKFYWSCESRVDVMTEELIDLLVKNHCTSIQFGVESGNQEVLDSLNKRFQLTHLEKIITYAAKYPVSIFTSFMLGHYKDTKETMEETIGFARHLQELNANVDYGISINTPFPGTWQYDNAEEIGLIITDKDFSHYNLVTPVIRTAAFNEQDLFNLYRRANEFIS